MIEVSKERSKNFPYQLAAIDIDDTLVGPDKQISAANRAAVKRLQAVGCRVVLASGRHHGNILPFGAELGLTDFVVSSQGALTRHAATGEVLHHAALPVYDAAEVTAEGLERGMTVMYWCADGVFARQRTKWVERYSADCGGDPVTLLDVESFAGRGTPPAEKVVWGAEPAVIAALAPELRRRFAGRMLVTVTDDFFVEFTAPHATKAEGVAAVARHYGVDPAGVLAFGDGNNDVALLQWAGMGVAMFHGRPSAHAAARLISPPGDPETGLCRAVTAILGGLGLDAGEAAGCRGVAA